MIVRVISLSLYLSRAPQRSISMSSLPAPYPAPAGSGSSAAHNGTASSSDGAIADVHAMSASAPPSPVAGFAHRVAFGAPPVLPSPLAAVQLDLMTVTPPLSPPPPPLPLLSRDGVASPNSTAPATGAIATLDAACQADSSAIDAAPRPRDTNPTGLAEVAPTGPIGPDGTLELPHLSVSAPNSPNSPRSAAEMWAAVAPQTPASPAALLAAAAAAAAAAMVGAAGSPEQSDSAAPARAVSADSSPAVVNTCLQGTPHQADTSARPPAASQPSSPLTPSAPALHLAPARRRLRVLSPTPVPPKSSSGAHAPPTSAAEAPSGAPSALPAAPIRPAPSDTQAVVGARTPARPGAAESERERLHNASRASLSSSSRSSATPLAPLGPRRSAIACFPARPPPPFAARSPRPRAIAATASALAGVTATTSGAGGTATLALMGFKPAIPIVGSSPRATPSVLMLATQPTDSTIASAGGAEVCTPLSLPRLASAADGPTAITSPAEAAALSPPLLPEANAPATHIAVSDTLPLAASTASTAAPRDVAPSTAAGTAAVAPREKGPELPTHPAPQVPASPTTASPPPASATVSTSVRTVSAAPTSATAGRKGRRAPPPLSPAVFVTTAEPRTVHPPPPFLVALQARGPMAPSLPPAPQVVPSVRVLDFEPEGLAPLPPPPAEEAMLPTADEQLQSSREELPAPSADAPEPTTPLGRVHRRAREPSPLAISSSALGPDSGEVPGPRGTARPVRVGYTTVLPAPPGAGGRSAPEPAASARWEWPSAPNKPRVHNGGATTGAVVGTAMGVGATALTPVSSAASLSVLADECVGPPFATPDCGLSAASPLTAASGAATPSRPAEGGTSAGLATASWEADPLNKKLRDLLLLASPRSVGPPPPPTVSPPVAAALPPPDSLETERSRAGATNSDWGSALLPRPYSRPRPAGGAAILAASGSSPPSGPSASRPEAPSSVAGGSRTPPPVSALRLPRGENVFAASELISNSEEEGSLRPRPRWSSSSRHGGDSNDESSWPERPPRGTSPRNDSTSYEWFGRLPSYDGYYPHARSRRHSLGDVPADSSVSPFHLSLLTAGETPFGTRRLFGSALAASLGSLASSFSTRSTTAQPALPPTRMPLIASPVEPMLSLPHAMLANTGSASGPPSGLPPTGSPARGVPSSTAVVPPLPLIPAAPPSPPLRRARSPQSPRRTASPPKPPVVGTPVRYATEPPPSSPTTPPSPLPALRSGTNTLPPTKDALAAANEQRRAEQRCVIAASQRARLARAAERWNAEEVELCRLLTASNPARPVFPEPYYKVPPTPWDLVAPFARSPSEGTKATGATEAKAPSAGSAVSAVNMGTGACMGRDPSSTPVGMAPTEAAGMSGTHLAASLSLRDVIVMQPRPLSPSASAEGRLTSADLPTLVTALRDSSAPATERAASASAVPPQRDSHTAPAFLPSTGQLGPSMSTAMFAAHAPARPLFTAAPPIEAMRPAPAAAAASFSASCTGTSRGAGSLLPTTSPTIPTKAKLSPVAGLPSFEAAAAEHAARSAALRAELARLQLNGARSCPANRLPRDLNASAVQKRQWSAGPGTSGCLLGPLVRLLQPPEGPLSSPLSGILSSKRKTSGGSFVTRSVPSALLCRCIKLRALRVCDGLALSTFPTHTPHSHVLFSRGSGRLRVLVESAGTPDDAALLRQSGAPSVGAAASLGELPAAHRPVRASPVAPPRRSGPLHATVTPSADATLPPPGASERRRVGGLRASSWLFGGAGDGGRVLAGENLTRRPLGGSVESGLLAMLLRGSR